jgi:hypothetical protein
MQPFLNGCVPKTAFKDLAEQAMANALCQLSYDATEQAVASEDGMLAAMTTCNTACRALHWLH